MRKECMGETEDIFYGEEEEGNKVFYVTITSTRELKAQLKAS